MLPLVGVLTHIVDQNNTKDMRNIQVKNGYVLHLSILNHHFNSLENLYSRYESPFIAIRKNNVLRSLGERITGRGAKIWPEALGREGTLGQCWYWFCSTILSHTQNRSLASCIPLNVLMSLNNTCFRKE